MPRAYARPSTPPKATKATAYRIFHVSLVALTARACAESAADRRALGNNAAILDTRDYLHIAVGAHGQYSADDVSGFLRGAERDAIKFLCVNDLPEVERSFPDARAWIEEAIGG